MIEKDTYKTIESLQAPILYKEKNSKFYGYAFPVTNEEEVKNHLDRLKKEHHSASHWCYAYQLGTEAITYRVNDDGEPYNSAGLPIYGQIQSFEVTNVLLVIVRHYGGVKLGVGGLISAYKTTAQMILEHSKIIEKTIFELFIITFGYKNINLVMRIIKEKQLDIIDQKLEMDCQIKISVRKKEADRVFEIFTNLFEINIDKLQSIL